MMDAVEFIMKRERMCKPNIAHCKSCPVDIEIRKRGLETTCYNFQVTYPKTFVEIVEQWNKEHPRKTRQSEFLKMFPDAKIFKGTLAINPCMVVHSRLNTEECHMFDQEGNLGCHKCREKFWSEEVDDGHD